MGTPLSIARTKKCDEDTKRAEQEAEKEHKTTLTLFRTNHGCHCAKERP